MGRLKTKSYSKELNDIYDFINDKFRIDIADKKKTNHYVDLRTLFYKIALDCTLATVEEIGAIVNRDHSTVVYARATLFEFVMRKKYIREAYNEFFGVDVDKVSSVDALNKLREIAASTSILKINNAGLTDNEIAYRKLTDSQKEIYNERAALIIKGFHWKEHNSSFEVINVGISSN